MMNGNEKPLCWLSAAGAPGFAAIELQLQELFAEPMGFMELALALAGPLAFRPRSEYERHRLPSRN